MPSGVGVVLDVGLRPAKVGCEEENSKTRKSGDLGSRDVRTKEE